MATKHSFYAGDYIVFAVTICISVGIGIFYALSGGRQKTTTEYLLGGRAMRFIPVAISLWVSFESSIMMLGNPAEGYLYGIQFIWGNAGVFCSQLFSALVMVPLLHPLKITSAYEYLELRFNSRAVRLAGTVFGMLGYVWYMGVVLFGPAVALEAVTGFSRWSTMVTISLVSVLYTSIGGIKAVIWTDVFQALVMMSGIIAILIKGTIDVGGPTKVWNIAAEGGRLDFFDFDTDLTKRHTFWNLFLFTFLRGIGLCFNQSSVQRISSIPSLSQAKKVLAFTAPAFFISSTLTLYEGTVAYAFYQTVKCDPFEAKQITDPNQILPYTVMDIFKNMPGMPGLFLASLFSASLSTLSSGLSSLSALMWVDILRPILGNISETKATFLTKISVVIFGAGATGVAVIVSQIGGTMVQITGTLLAAFIGPLSGLFFLGCFCPRTNAKGALIGVLSGAAFTSWISLGKSFSPSVQMTPYLPPTSTDNCPIGAVENTTTLIENITSSAIAVLSETNTTSNQVVIAPEGLEKLYTMSYTCLPVVGILTTLVAGVLVSLVTGQNRPGDVDPRFLIPVSDVIFPFLPKSWRHRIASVGPQFIKEEYRRKFLAQNKVRDVYSTEEVVEVELSEDLLQNGKKNSE